MNLKDEMIKLGQNQKDIEELRGGHTLDKLPKDFLVETPRNGYAVAEVEKLIDIALQNTERPNALSIARQITSKLEAYFSAALGGDDSLRLRTQLEATKASGVKMQEKLTKAQLETSRALEKLESTEVVLEQACKDNNKLRTGMSIYEERIGTLIDIIKNILESK